MVCGVPYGTFVAKKVKFYSPCGGDSFASSEKQREREGTVQKPLRLSVWVRLGCICVSEGGVCVCVCVCVCVVCMCVCSVCVFV